jgi:hypothetical protein
MVMPFELTNVPVTFQGHVKKSPRVHLDVFCKADLEDFLIYSQTLEEHILHVCLILDLLQQVGLLLKLQKCEFHHTTT